MPEPLPCECYRIGDGDLEVRSADAGFRERLALLYRECAVEDAPDPGRPRIRCIVRGDTGDPYLLVTIEDADAAQPAIDQADFLLGVFPDRGYTEIPPEGEWRRIALTAGPTGMEAGSSMEAGSLDPAHIVSISGPDIIVRQGTPWRALVGSLAVSRVIHRQPRSLFMHAASIGVRGAGVLVVGPKSSGKTTLSLALATRGHDFLGDEIAGIRVDTRELMPVRRSLAIRPGPRARRVDDVLNEIEAPAEDFPDGSTRQRAHARDLLFGSAAHPLPLKHVLFLRGFDASPALETVRPDRQWLRELTPMGASLWGASPIVRVRDMLSLLTAADCRTLTAGDPDESAALVESMVEE